MGHFSAASIRLFKETAIATTGLGRVFPAITTPFKPDLAIDYQALASQLEKFTQSGCQGIVALGSLGEAPVLEPQEKLEILKQASRILHGRVPLSPESPP